LKECVQDMNFELNTDRTNETEGHRGGKQKRQHKESKIKNGVRKEK
jgi:hypothetical protein